MADSDLFDLELQEGDNIAESDDDIIEVDDVSTALSDLYFSFNNFVDLIVLEDH